MFLCIPTAVSKACGKHTSQFVWRRLCRCEWWGWDRCRLLSSHWSFQQSVWRNWAWVKIKMGARWKGVWRSPEYFVVECTTRSISSCQCLISEWLTCSLCYCYTVSIKHLEATAVEICFYINAFEFTERLFHCVRITFLFLKTAPLIKATCKVTAAVTLDVLVCFANCDCSVCQAHTTTGRCTKP